jgi:hypothetical protein
VNKLVDKKEGTNKFSLMKKLFFVLLIMAVVGVAVFTFFGDTFKFNDFIGPNYIPANYNNSANQTTDNERIFEFSGNGTFWVGVVKNTNNTDLTDLFHPFVEDPSTVNVTNENITVNGHTVLFEVHTMSIDMKEMAAGMPELSKYDMPNLSLSKFHAEWYCEKSHLTYVTTGLVTPNQTEEMKKMIQSIPCHQNKKYLFF